MSYFEDLTEYTYREAAKRPKTVNVGWLEAGHPFNTELVTEELLSRLWRFCEYSIVALRGFYECNLPVCSGHVAEYGPLDPKRWRLVGKGPLCARRGDVVLTFGNAEIRVFGENGTIYAAPNLIYHYVTVHSYKMPDEFKRALANTACPPDAEYFERLTQLGLKWTKTLTI